MPSSRTGPTWSARARALFGTWRGRFIVAWLAVQLTVPCCYYLARRDPHDERFAWRMFSPMRMLKCDPRFTIGDQRIDLGARFHEAWLRLAERGRYDVLETMGARLCRELPDRRIQLDLVCTDVTGAPEHIGGYDICKVTEL